MNLVRLVCHLRDKSSLVQFAPYAHEYQHTDCCLVFGPWRHIIVECDNILSKFCFTWLSSTTCASGRKSARPHLPRQSCSYRGLDCSRPNRNWNCHVIGSADHFILVVTLVSIAIAYNKHEHYQQQLHDWQHAGLFGWTVHWTQFLESASGSVCRGFYYSVIRYSVDVAAQAAGGASIFFGQPEASAGLRQNRKLRRRASGGATILPCPAAGLLETSGIDADIWRFCRPVLIYLVPKCDPVF